MSDGGEAPFDLRHLRELIKRDVLEELGVARLRTATVDGRDGGRVRYSYDGEERGSRLEGVPAPRGVRHEAGDRLVVGTTESGEEFAVASLTESENRQAVGNDELYTDAVDERALRSKAVKGRHIDAAQVQREHIATNAVGANELAGDSVGSTQLKARAVGTAQLQANSVGGTELKAGSVGGAQLEGTIANRISGAVQDGDIQDAAGKGKPALATEDYVKRAQPDLGGLVKKSELAAGAVGKEALATKADLTRLKRDLEAFVNSKVKASKGSRE